MGGGLEKEGAGGAYRGLLLYSFRLLAGVGSCGKVGGRRRGVALLATTALNSEH